MPSPGEIGRVGFCGLGIMGSRMAANLRAAGHDLTVWNRTAATAESWASEHDAAHASTPAEVAASCDAVITLVVDGPQVESVLLGAGGAVEGAHEDSLFVDMSTIGPAAARRIGERLADRGVAFMDAPVTGSSPKAFDGTLTIMAGGSERDFMRALVLFDAMGELVVHAGPLGHGQMVKLLNNAVAAVNTAAAAEALLLAGRAGVDLDALITVMRAGSGGSAMLDLKARPMIEHDYETLFKLAHMHKDVRLCLEEARAAGLPMTLVARVEEILAAAEGMGYGDDDFAALIEPLRSAAGDVTR
jgi:3-hydroxyisobutyrate dehydrogenase